MAEANSSTDEVSGGDGVSEVGVGGRSGKGCKTASEAKPQAGEPEAVKEAGGSAARGTAEENDTAAGQGPHTPAEFGEADDTEEVVDGGAGRSRLTPRQARRLRMGAGGVLMVVMAVVLVVRLAARTSVLVVGVYGAALILCGIVIELSRQGRTRLGTWLLVVGLAAAVVADRLLP
ncbi:hypothetical protein ACFV3R_04805 [Streptomyces sp. NPDC059740]|uniref:hypothetical protein n=1 Tax=Streptomyces sp. NPDC059740 TaxID=3346926 RepID=UPI00365B6EF1